MKMQMLMQMEQEKGEGCMVEQETTETALEAYFRDRIHALEAALDALRLRLARYEGTLTEGGNE